jgi:hypothetical protein
MVTINLNPDGTAFGPSPRDLKLNMTYNAGAPAGRTHQPLTPSRSTASRVTPSAIGVLAIRTS